SIEDRIVSVGQPHVRPIVRGKTNARVEVGAILSVRLVSGYALMDVRAGVAYHEGTGWRDAVEEYDDRHGDCATAVVVEPIERTPENRKFCKERGSRMSGPKLGRPSKNEQVNVAQKRVERQDASERNAIEGKFGEGKRTYGLGLISACLQNTSETAISISFLMMNIGKILRDSFFTFLLIFHVTFSKENNHIYSI